MNIYTYVRKQASAIESSTLAHRSGKLNHPLLRVFFLSESCFSWRRHLRARDDFRQAPQRCRTQIRIGTCGQLRCWAAVARSCLAPRRCWPPSLRGYLNLPHGCRQIRAGVGDVGSPTERKGGGTHGGRATSHRRRGWVAVMRLRRHPQASIVIEGFLRLRLLRALVPLVLLGNGASPRGAAGRRRAARRPCDWGGPLRRLIDAWQRWRRVNAGGQPSQRLVAGQRARVAVWRCSG